MSIKSYFKKLFKKKEEPDIFQALPGGGYIIPVKGNYQVNFSDAYSKIIEEREKRNADDRIILNSFDNNVKVLYEELKPYTQNQYTFGFMSRGLQSDIKICEILDRHLKLNKFNKTLEDIINE